MLFFSKIYFYFDRVRSENSRFEPLKVLLCGTKTQITEMQRVKTITGRTGINLFCEGGDLSALYLHKTLDVKFLLVVTF